MQKVYDITVLVYRRLVLGLKTAQATKQSHNSSVGIALRYGLDDRGSRVRFPAEAGNLSLHHRVQNGSGPHPASYPMGTKDPSLGVKRPGREADHSPPSSSGVKEWVKLYLRSPNTPSWRGAQLKSTGIPLPLPFRQQKKTVRRISCWHFKCYLNEV
jgi:hypothetical protein